MSFVITLRHTVFYAQVAYWKSNLSLPGINSCFCAAVVCNVQVEKLTSTAVRVSWDALHLPGITGYRIFYSKMLENRKTPSDQEVFAVNVSSSSENVVDVLGLANYVGYQFEVVATAELEGAEVLGNRSVTTMLILAPLSAPSETVATDEDEGNVPGDLEIAS